MQSDTLSPCHFERKLETFLRFRVGVWPLYRGSVNTIPKTLDPRLLPRPEF
jgi:hypothetical protein